jgi:hypothetical protein
MTTLDELFDYWCEWNRTDKVERFGQYVINRWGLEMGEYPRIYYQENPIAAFHMLCDVVQGIYRP